MANPYYDLYIQSVLKLARSLVVKNTLTAKAINKEIEFMGGVVDRANPRTWKYYQNLAGEYHRTDQMIEITSIDTLQTIEFTKENLRIHRATAEEYGFGSRYYNQLVDQHPDRELLIRGIIDPVDIDKAIESEDGTILAWDESEVEFNEVNLIPRLQTWTINHFHRWNIPEFSMTDELYPAAYVGVMFSKIPSVILNIRLSNCRTNYVHSFHVRQYLASNGELDVFLDTMTTKQALWLYRNINYLLRHCGRKETFNQLVKHILTDRGIALAQYDMRHNLVDLNQNLRPDPQMQLSFLNYNVGSDYESVRTIDEVLEKEIADAPDNLEENELARQYVPKKIQLSMSDKGPTKVLESIVTDTSNNTAYSFEKILIHHWLYLAAKGRYIANININHPVTGQVVTLTVKEAFVSYLYAYNKIGGTVLEDIPPLVAPSVKRPLQPTVDQLADIVGEKVKREDLERSKEGHPPMGVFESVGEFRDFCLDLRDLLRAHREIFILKEDPQVRGQLEMAMSTYWQDVQSDIYAGTNYNQWFEDRGLDFHTLPDLELGLLSESLLEASTGTDLSDTNALQDLQDAMVGIMERLSSYSVQYVKTINSSTSIRAEWAGNRVGNIGDRFLSSANAHQARVKPLRVRGNYRAGIDPKLVDMDPYRVGVEQGGETYYWDIVPRTKFKDTTTARLLIENSRNGVQSFTITPKD